MISWTLIDAWGALFMVIREFNETDRLKAQALLQQHTTMPQNEIEQTLNEGQRLVALQDEVLCGLATLNQGRPHLYEFGILVDPAVRRQGIGDALWRQLVATAPDAQMICCTCPAQNADGHAFLQANAFASWFGEELMHYTGPNLPDPQLTVRPYGDEDFDDWVRLINEGFYPIREANDIRPYTIFDVSDPATRQKLLNSGDDKLLFYDGDQLVGLAGLNCSGIDPITVASDQRRKGYARQIVAHCTNRMLARVAGPAALQVSTRNVGARKLYESMGYRIVEKQDWFRLLLGQN